MEDQRTEDQEQRDQPVGRGADIQGARTHHRQPHHAVILSNIKIHIGLVAL
jgi:hypothetical protein